MHDDTRSADLARIEVELEQWRSLADMLAHTLWEKLGQDHESCDENDCAVAFVLARHAEMVR